MVLFNPISGTGRAAAAANALAERLRAASHDALITPTQLQPSCHWLDHQLEAVDLLVVCGGDGAVRLAAESAIRTGKPLYHFPSGTENLFAREFGMDRDPQTLLNAIHQFKLQKADVGMANGEAFLLMASVGFDAEVVAELAQRRGKSISHLSYVLPILNQLRRWSPPRLQVFVDDERIDDGETGFVVIGNCKQYGWRLNPAGRASMFDGRFDVAYFPAKSRAALLGWAWRCRTQRHFAHPRLIYRTGTRVTVRCDRMCRYQLDGDPPAEAIGKRRDAGSPLLDVAIRPAALPILVPAAQIAR